MCSSLLEDLAEVRRELRESKWSEERDAGNNIIRVLFTSSGDQIQNIIETLNLLSLIVPEKADEVKDVAKQIVSRQQEKGHLTLVDLKDILTNILAPTEATILNQMVDRSQNLFGTSPESVHFQPANLSRLDGTFDYDFSSSLLISPPGAPSFQPTSQPQATSSLTNEQTTKNGVFSKMENLNPSFAEKLRRFRE